MKKYGDWKGGNYGGNISAEDTTCGVTCTCGYGLNESGLWVSENEITRCPTCGRGYRTEFVVWQFEKDEGE